jgi:hypothetical protein
MALILTEHPEFGSSTSPHVGPNRDVVTYQKALGIFSTLGDEVKMCPLPYGAKYEWARMVFPDALDNGAGLRVDLVLTDGTTNKFVIQNSAAADNGGVAEPGSVILELSHVGFVAPDDQWYFAVRCRTASGGNALAGSFTTIVEYQA